MNPAILGASADMDAAAGAIVLASILEQVLQNKGSITPFAGDEERSWNVCLHLEAEGIGQRIQIVQPFFDEPAQIDGRKFDLEVSRVHSRKEQEVVDHAGEAIGLVMKRGELVVEGRIEMFMTKQLLNTGTQDRNGSFELVRRVRRKTGRAFQFLMGSSQGCLDTLAAHPIFLRIDREFRDRRRQLFCDEMACDK